jgi:hypothetical protein
VPIRGKPGPFLAVLCQPGRVDHDRAEGSPDDRADAGPATTAPPRRAKTWLFVVAALVIGAGAGVGATLLLTGDDEDEQPAASQPRAPGAGSDPLAPGAGADELIAQACLDRGGRLTVQVAYSDPDPDATMQRAADALRDDDRIASITTETRQEAYVRFTEIFADQPELLEIARPEALSASVLLVPADGLSVEELTDDLRDELTGVDEFTEGCEE